MNLCFSSNALTLHPPKLHPFKTYYLSQPLFTAFHVNPTPFCSSQVVTLLHLTRSTTSKRVFHIRASLAPLTVEETKTCSFREENPKDVNVFGGWLNGYTGKFVVKELLNRGFNVIAIAREQSGIKGEDRKEETLKKLRGANVWFSDVTKIDSLENSLESIGSPINVVVSCLASRSGGVKDSWKVDYEFEV